MEAKKAPLSDVHIEDYLAEYAGLEKTAEDTVFPGGRRAESLSGLWHYAVDPYDTCLRQHWYSEHKVSAGGFSESASTCSSSPMRWKPQMGTALSNWRM